MASVRAALHQQLETAFSMLRYLCEHRFGATISELAAEGDVTKRTVYRFLESFKRSGIQIVRISAVGTTKYRLANRPRMTDLLGIM